MQFNPGNSTGIVDEINDICNTNNTSYPLTSKTRRVNQGLDRFYKLAYEVDSNWHFDDDGNTSIPSATQDLVSGSMSYFFDSGILQLKGVFVKDSSGVYHELTQNTNRKPFTVPSNNSGVPTSYILFGANILLDPIPNYNSSDGLKVVFTRRAVQFLSTNTTEEPGIPTIFHSWLAQYAALPFLVEKQLAQKNDMAEIVRQGENDIRRFMAQRNDTVPPRLVPKQENTR